MGFGQRVGGILFNPRPTAAGLAAKPVWLDALVVVLLLTAVFGYLVSPFATRDTLQMSKDNPVLKEKMGAERYDNMIRGLENPSPTRRLTMSGLMGPAFAAVGLLLASVILLVLGRLVSSEGAFAPVFALVVHAALIDKGLGGAVRTGLIFLRKSVFQTSTSLALLVPKADVMSIPYILLSQVDFFQLWMFAVVGYGLSTIFKIPVRKAMGLSFGYWVLRYAFNLGLTFLGRSFMS